MIEPFAKIVNSYKLMDPENELKPFIWKYM